LTIFQPKKRRFYGKIGEFALVAVSKQPFHLGVQPRRDRCFYLFGRKANGLADMHLDAAGAEPPPIPGLQLAQPA
jgi:hypothetical protein